MRALGSILLLLAATTAQAQHTIEGFWQDAQRRILYDRNAPSYYQYGAWTQLDLEQTYPSAKEIRKAAGGYELIDLLYDDEYTIKVLSANPERIRFTRTGKFPACTMYHDCRLISGQLMCTLENFCQDAKGEVLDWRGEERYIRRASCERDGKRQAQGIPVKCR